MLVLEPKHSNVLVNNGETIAIAGLLSEEEPFYHILVLKWLQTKPSIMAKVAQNATVLFVKDVWVFTKCSTSHLWLIF